ncbi:uncharacterized protein LACBIDRAFT_300386 [Laccaria bicolor S238N-H82]|uniref:Predicted protein n=1 Tax=Laccaria bicolor (strain S238N-H82 / ATCC MYA-4686) TaxID=486041 RepID=B0DGM7_LACBS|nr:uncharacterized protein LACBIDRAFT_300386 [Laccaria bicolor S238N-H82]EDR06178.1 predicted protein [Laccaria bicolor S238N-H82]|eukprot:XP_001883039.1 predicted protein [Laccaria bicolor S238N-H82]
MLGPGYNAKPNLTKQTDFSESEPEHDFMPGPLPNARRHDTPRRAVHSLFGAMYVSALLL